MAGAAVLGEFVGLGGEVGCGTFGFSTSQFELLGERVDLEL
jgi:hypothetical protein